jgi:TonB family protein
MVRFRDRLTNAALILAFVIPVKAYCADDPAALLERLRTADSESALDTPGLKPWHLKLAIQIFDEKGEPADQGTVEEWWSSPEHDRREYKSNTYSATELRTGDKLYRTKAASSPPYYLELLREQAVHPIPKYAGEAEGKPELRKQPFGKVQLECIMLSQPLSQFGFLPLGLFPTYCFDVGKNSLRVSVDFGSQLVIRNVVGTFQGKKVATKVDLMSDGVERAASETVNLQTLLSPDVEPGADELEEKSLDAVKVSGGVMAGMILSRKNPIYPESAKRNHISGVVILHAIIGSDGRIHSLKLVSAPDPDLAISAIAAVRSWTYKPYTLMGIPTDVETTINVNYTFGPG